MNRLDELKEVREGYRQYLLLCVRMEGWHGVRDTASDLDCIDARIKERESNFVDVFAPA